MGVAKITRVVIVFGTLALGRVAVGQTSANLLAKPWEADQTLEDQTDGFVLNSGHTKETNHSFQFSGIESYGRVRLFPGNEASPRFGYDVVEYNSHTTQAGFPHQLIDASIAGGTFLSKSNGWVTGLTLGVGYAGDTPFARSSALYGRADFVIAKIFSDTDALGIGMDYDGNRTFLPDVPLPGFGYSHQFDPKLTMVFGLPTTSITWKPIDHLRIHADYLLLSDFNVDVGYEFIPHFSAYGGISSRHDAFHVARLQRDHRLLFNQRRAEVGLRYIPTPQVTLHLAVGYAFDNGFGTGFDLRTTHRVLHFSDEPYISAGLDLRF